MSQLWLFGKEAWPWWRFAPIVRFNTAMHACGSPTCCLVWRCHTGFRSILYPDRSTLAKPAQLYSVHHLRLRIYRIETHACLPLTKEPKSTKEPSLHWAGGRLQGIFRRLNGVRSYPRLFPIERQMWLQALSVDCDWAGFACRSLWSAWLQSRK